MALQQEWMISINRKLKQGSQAKQSKPWRKHSIYKIPHWLKDQQHPNAEKISGYIPEIVSIGPYHHGEPHLQPMETHKWRFLSHKLSRENQDITMYLTEINKIEDVARGCYDQPILGLNSNDFVQMLVLDGCFVLEFLRGIEEEYNNLDNSDEDPVFCKESIYYLIAMDLMKLENQIPMIVLEKLHEIHYHGSVPKLVISVLSPTWVTSTVNMEDIMKMREVLANEHNNEKPMVHCLDVFRRSLLYKPGLPDSLPSICAEKNGCHTEGEYFMACCISDLRNAGIKFEPSHCVPFCEVNFRERRGVLEILPFEIDCSTESVFRNLIAYEQCHMTRAQDMVITDYVAFMDNLIDTAADVAYLREAKIIVHYLGSDAEVAELFNKLGKKVYVNKIEGRLNKVYQKLNDYCRHRRYRWGASLQNDYLRNPWVIISIIAAFLLFVFTAVQTVYTVVAYYKPGNPPS